LDLALGFLIGLGLGCAGAVLRETLDNTIKSTDDVQRLTGRPAIGVIAFDPDAKSNPLVVVEDLHGVRSEAFRQLRTNLQFVDVDTPLRSIVCTSSVPAEGKTTTICNLAITLAHTGMRVLLVEADLRRPRVGQYMGLDNAVGLTSVLIGAAEFDDAVQHWGKDRLLDVLASGPTPPNPSELLGSRGMAQLLRTMEERYDLVLLDAPPLLPVTDAAVLAVETTGAVVIVHHGKTRREQLENSANALAAVGAQILGTVINFAPRKGPEAYYYGYAYDYRRPDKPAAPPASQQRSQPVLPVRPEPIYPPPVDPPRRSGPPESQDRPTAQSAAPPGEHGANHLGSPSRESAVEEVSLHPRLTSSDQPPQGTGDVQVLDTHRDLAPADRTLWPAREDSPGATRPATPTFSDGRTEADDSDGGSNRF
jgi:non-specific protein-tyrosine kinase